MSGNFKYTFYTPKEVMEMLRLKDIATVHLMCRSGMIHGAIKVGRHDE